MTNNKLAEEARLDFLSAQRGKAVTISGDELADFIERYRARGAELQEYRKAAGELIASFKEVLRISDRDHEAWDRAKSAINMFGNSEHVIQPYKLPDGWVAVPKEPTESMVIDGFESEPDEFFSKSEEWGAYQEMSGCEQAAHRAKLCWAAMIAAAPQQEE